MITMNYKILILVIISIGNPPYSTTDILEFSDFNICQPLFIPKEGITENQYINELNPNSNMKSKYANRTIQFPISKTPIQIGLPCSNNGFIDWKYLSYRIIAYLFWCFILSDIFLMYIHMPIGLFEFMTGPDLENQYTVNKN